MDFLPLSKELTKKLTRDEKKTNGIYFTPTSTVKDAINEVSKIIPFKKTLKILEPSCGSGEFLNGLKNKWPSSSITGIEINETIIRDLKKVEEDGITIIKCNYLDYKSEAYYDLIIGNPPYFVMNDKRYKYIYKPYFTGRLNIFIPFIVNSLNILNDKGILAFILPSSFLNCLYYDNLRNHINLSFDVLQIKYCKAKYMDTQQETILFIVQKTNSSSSNNKFLMKLAQYTIFGVPEDIKRLKELKEHSTTLENLGFEAKIGEIVWNQHKDKLTYDDGDTLLIYNTNIKEGEFKNIISTNKEKKPCIKKKGRNTPLLIVNRGYGMGNYVFDFCLIDGKREYLVENHLICLHSKNTSIDAYEKVILSFKDKRTIEFIKLYFKNNAINCSELIRILPIYQDI